MSWCRLAEAIQAETIPIYIWDHVQMLPYLVCRQPPMRIVHQHADVGPRSVCKACRRECFFHCAIVSRHDGTLTPN